MFRRIYPWLLGALFLFTGVLSARTPAEEKPPTESELAKTPPMGWNSWNAFDVNISDAIIRAQARAMVKSGMKAAGYQYMVIDGGWEGHHDARGEFQPDAKRFPDMKGLCDFIHSLGLKAGIHTTPGPLTGAGREGSYGHEAQDAKLFARWGMDFVKYDWCSGSEVYKPEQMRAVYQQMGDDIRATHRPMLYSICQYGMEDVWKWGAAAGGQMWRTTGDIKPDYYQVMMYGFSQNGLEKYAGPGHWNDPDMLEVGNGKITENDSRSQMTLWCIEAAPLFAGNDLTKMSQATRAILTNPEVIAVDQDSTGVQGRRVWQDGPIQIWLKLLSDHSVALGIFSIENHAMNVAINFHDLELKLPATVRVRDLWLRKDLGDFHEGLKVTLPKHGAVLLKINYPTIP